MKISQEKLANLKKLLNEDGAIAALAIDQRGSMEKMMEAANPSLNNVEGIGPYKELVSKELTPFASSILLDPIYGQKGIKAKDANAATKLYRIMDNLEHILAIELMNAAQGIDFRRPAKTSPVLERFLHEYRKEVPFVKEDIVMYKEIHKTVAFLNRTKFDY